jgi:hypothetical protein
MIFGSFPNRVGPPSDSVRSAEFGAVSEKTRILTKPGSILEVHDPFSFSAPPFTGPHRHAMVMYALIDRLTHLQHSRSALLRCAVLAYWFDNGF